MTANHPTPNDSLADRLRELTTLADRLREPMTTPVREWSPPCHNGVLQIGHLRRHRCRPPVAAAKPGGATRWWATPRRGHRFGHGASDHGSGDSADSDHTPERADGNGVLAAVREQAAEVHERLAHDHDVFAVELVGSTGGGKTALAERLLDRWDGRVGVICGDVAGEDDARRYRDHDVPVANVTTGKDCHLDPGRIDDALDTFDLDALDTLVVENVGNMVCPADFPLGATVRVLVVSPTEGDDVVRKHPLLFQAVDVAVVNKVDIADAVCADTDRMVADATAVAPGLSVLETSAETGRGIDDFAALLERHRDHDHQPA